MNNTLPLTQQAPLPTHVAIIMDGNGRWAKSRGERRTEGHKQGAEALRRIMQACRDESITMLTVYAFSSENWRRPAGEIIDLMQLLKWYLKHELKEIHKNRIRLRVIGDRARLDKDIRNMIEDAEKLTAANTEFNLNLALSYGSREEMVRAVRTLARRVQNGLLAPGAIDEETIAAALDTGGLPDPDLLIRTGGEERLSNFLLWQSAYTELYFTDILWPDFSAAHLREALGDYAARERRFGGANE